MTSATFSRLMLIILIISYSSATIKGKVIYATIKAENETSLFNGDEENSTSTTQFLPDNKTGEIIGIEITAEKRISEIHARYENAGNSTTAPLLPDNKSLPPWAWVMLGMCLAYLLCCPQPIRRLFVLLLQLIMILLKAAQSLCKAILTAVRCRRPDKNRPMVSIIATKSQSITCQSKSGGSCCLKDIRITFLSAKIPETSEL